MKQICKMHRTSRRLRNPAYFCNLSASNSVVFLSCVKCALQSVLCTVPACLNVHHKNVFGTDIGGGSHIIHIKVFHLLEENLALSAAN